MGWRKQPTPSLEESASEEYLRRIRHAYATDAIDADRLELLTAHVVAGGHLGRRLEPRVDPEPGSGLAAALRRGYRPPEDAGMGLAGEWR